MVDIWPIFQVKVRKGQVKFYILKIDLEIEHIVLISIKILAVKFPLEAYKIIVKRKNIFIACFQLKNSKIIKIWPIMRSKYVKVGCNLLS